MDEPASQDCRDYTASFHGVGPWKCVAFLLAGGMFSLPILVAGFYAPSVFVCLFGFQITALVAGLMASRFPAALVLTMSMVLGLSAGMITSAQLQGYHEHGWAIPVAFVTVWSLLLAAFTHGLRRAFYAVK